MRARQQPSSAGGRKETAGLRAPMHPFSHPRARLCGSSPPQQHPICQSPRPRPRAIQRPARPSICPQPKLRPKLVASWPTNPSASLGALARAALLLPTLSLSLSPAELHFAPARQDIEPCGRCHSPSAPSPATLGAIHADHIDSTHRTLNIQKLQSKEMQFTLDVESQAGGAVNNTSRVKRAAFRRAGVPNAHRTKIVSIQEPFFFRPPVAGSSDAPPNHKPQPHAPPLHRHARRSALCSLQLITQTPNSSPFQSPHFLHSSHVPSACSQPAASKVNANIV